MKFGYGQVIPSRTSITCPAKCEWNYPFPNFHGATVQVWEWISNFIPHFIMNVITYPCLIQISPCYHVSKKRLWRVTYMVDTLACFVTARHRPIFFYPRLMQIWTHIPHAFLLFGTSRVGFYPSALYNPHSNIAWWRHQMETFSA